MSKELKSLFKEVKIGSIIEIPNHWNVIRLKDLGFLINGISKGKEYFGFGHPFVSYTNVYNDTISLHSITTYANSNAEEQKFYSVKEGDVFFTRTSETIDEIGFASTVLETIPKASFSGFVIRLRPKRRLLNKFYSKYLFRAHFNKNYLAGEINMVTRASLNQNVLSNLTVIIPPLTEQAQIAIYLDAKTQAIDKKINLLTTKIDYYKELRKTIINNAIYQGVPDTNSSPRLKNSGVYYVNTIKESWNLVRVKDLFVIGRGRVIGQDLLVDNGKYPVYSSQTENNGCLGYIETYDFNADMLTWTTDGANAGTVFRRSGKFNCTNVCGTLLPIRKNLDLNYMVYALQESAKHNKRIDTNGAKIMNNEMAVIQIPFPTKNEQTEIATYLDNKTSTIDKIITNLQTQIQTLKELRKSLINDVVTGKVKVN